MNEWSRRDWLKLAAYASTASMTVGCQNPWHSSTKSIDGGWVNDMSVAGHAWRDGRFSSLLSSMGQEVKRCSVAMVGSGIGGLATARTLSRLGIDDFRIFEMAPHVGGNSQGHQIGGQRCPLAAHYLPKPSAIAHEVQELLFDLGLLQMQSGRVVANERHLCHSPQERVYYTGRWHYGLTPQEGVSAQTLNEYRRFSAAVQEVKALGFSIPTHRSTWSPALAALDAVTMESWLKAHQFSDPWLYAVLDYACKDDYGAGISSVSAWAGLHYFASRHGFAVPGEGEEDDIFTWPQGNAWLAEQVASAFMDRCLVSSPVVQIEPGPHTVSLTVASVGEGGEPAFQRWQADHVVMCTPLFIARRLLGDVSPDLTKVWRTLGGHLQYAPWLVTQLQLKSPLPYTAHSALCWDNVRLKEGVQNAEQTVAGLTLPAGLGYVNASHQSLNPGTPATLLTHYWALGDGRSSVNGQRRQALLAESWQTWGQAVLSELQPMHPELPELVERMELHRMGHAMMMPTPGLRGSAALHALAQGGLHPRIHFAHADLSAYSIFEEAWTHGCHAGAEVAQRLKVG